MMTRPVFEHVDVADLIEEIRNEDSYFTIEPCANSEYLELRCVNPDQGSDFCFYMNYTADLASGIGREVEYRNGMIMFTDLLPDYDSGSETEDDFNLLMPVLETDYVVPMVEDIEECPVCYESYEPMYGSLCGHHACNNCMISMDARGLTKCPLCRSVDFKFPIALACNRSFVKV
jgi:hypothetical protein